MGVENFKPQIWSKVILAALQKNLVYGGPMVVNDDYDGEISGPGDALHITQFGDPTISTYTPGVPITYQNLIDAGMTLYINQSKNFSFAIDDVDRRQAAGDMQAYLEGRAAYKMADVADQFIAALYPGVSQANVLGSTGAPLTPLPYGGSASHPADAYVLVTEQAKVKLDEASVPDEDRYMICPPWFVGLLDQIEAFVKMTDSSGQATGVMQKGFQGQISGFNIMKSNNTPQPIPGAPGTRVDAIQFGHPMGITYGEQIVETEALRLQDQIADGVRGLHVYGALMTRPDTVGVAYVERPVGI